LLPPSKGKPIDTFQFQPGGAIEPGILASIFSFFALTGESTLSTTQWSQIG
jgi:hypothetical protein